MGLSKSFDCAFPGCERSKGHAKKCCSLHQPIMLAHDGWEAERYALSIINGRDMAVDAYELASDADFSRFTEGMEERFWEAYEEYERVEKDDPLSDSMVYNPQ